MALVLWPCVRMIWRCVACSKQVISAYLRFDGPATYLGWVHFVILPVHSHVSVPVPVHSLTTGATHPQTPQNAWSQACAHERRQNTPAHLPNTEQRTAQSALDAARPREQSCAPRWAHRRLGDVESSPSGRRMGPMAPLAPSTNGCSRWWMPWHLRTFSTLHSAAGRHLGRRHGTNLDSSHYF